MKRKRGQAVSVDAWRPQWIGDELAEKARLTTEQFGALQLLLMAYWRNHGSALPDDDDELATITGLSGPQWKKHRPKLAARFQVRDGRWHHPGLELEYAQAMEMATKRVERARKGAAGRWPEQQDLPGFEDAASNASSNAPSIGQAQLVDCPIPSPSPSHAAPTEREDAREPEPPGRHGLDTGEVVAQVALDDRTANAVAILKAMRNAGVRITNLHDPRLHKAIEAGVTADAVAALAIELTERNDGEAPAFAYVLSTAAGRLRDAAKQGNTNGQPTGPKVSAADAVLQSIANRPAGDPGDLVGD